MNEYNSPRTTTNPRSGRSPSAVRKVNGKSKKDYFENLPGVDKKEVVRRQTDRFRKIETKQFVSAINDCLKGKQSMYVLDPQKNYKSSTIQAGTIMQYEEQTYVVTAKKRNEIFLNGIFGEKIIVKFNRSGKIAKPKKITKKIKTTLESLL